MNRLLKWTIASMLLMMLVLNVGCGSSDTSGRTSTKTVFYPLSTIPLNGAKNVNPSDYLYITLSQPIDPTTVQSGGNLTVASFVSSGASVPGVLSFQDGYQTIVFIPTQNWGLNTTYIVTLSQSIKSTSGVQLSGDMTFVFSTGQSSILGQVSIPGAPYVVSLGVTNSTPWGDALAFRVEFNEDIAQLPNASVSISIGGVVNNGWFPINYVEPIFNNNMRYFYLLLDDYGCSDQYYGLFTKLTVTVFNATDADEGNFMPKYEKTFTYLSDYWRSPCN